MDRFRAPRQDGSRRGGRGPGPEAGALLRKYGVDYVVLGPLERGGGEMARIGAVVNESFFQRYTKVGQTGGYSLYKTSP